ncbi:MAG: SPL family radical SAM protein [Oscillospiraceae bacterium]
MHFVQAKTILSPKNGMNLYRGCQHGCIYCDSRSTCYQMEHPFEDIEVKENAIELLEDALRRKRHRCMIGTGAMTDPYIPLETELCYTRKALELIERYGFGVSILTKSNRILRDIDILKRINEASKCVVQMTLTTYDDNLCRKIEPFVCPTSERLEALKQMRSAGIPTVVWLDPILPFINDTAENINGLLDMCIEAGVYGVMCFNMGLTLREGNREYFYAQLDKEFPGLKERYIRTYGNSYVVDSPRNDELMQLFHRRCEENGIVHNIDQIFCYISEFEEKNFEQISLF